MNRNIEVTIDKNANGFDVTVRVNGAMHFATGRFVNEDIARREADAAWSAALDAAIEYLKD